MKAYEVTFTDRQEIRGREESGIYFPLAFCYEMGCFMYEPATAQKIGIIRTIQAIAMECKQNLS